MHFGADFFRIIQFVVAVMRLIGRIFGDDEDKKIDDDIQGNHAHEADKIIDTTNAAKTKQK